MECHSQKLCKKKCENCDQRSFASSPKAQYWSDLNVLTPRDVFLASGKKFWFDCDKCGHVFDIKLNCIKRGRWCQYCTLKLCDDDDCQICYAKSFASHPKAEHWSPENNVVPRNVRLGSRKKYIFDCPTCNHSFSSVINSIRTKEHCPYCSPSKKILCQNEECNFCYERSFAAHPKAKFWSPNNDVSPRDVTRSSGELFLFICDKCNHEFPIQLNNVIKNSWCGFCGGSKLCKEINCDFCYNKSFASHPKSKFWSKKNQKRPRDCCKSGKGKYLFNCDECGHEFSASLGHVSSSTEPRWCPLCPHKTETKLKRWLEENYKIKTHPTYDWCKNIATDKFFPFDFSIESEKIIIELDGPQHFKQISNWADLKQTQQRDRYKETMAIQNGYTIIRLLQENVLYDKFDWESLLDKSIKRKRDRPTITTIYNNIEMDVEYIYILEFNSFQME